MQKRKKALVITAAAVSFIIIVYLGFALFFTKHFYLNTVINGVDYSACSVEVVQNRIMDTSGHYVLTVNGRDGLTDTITSSDIALRSVFGDEFEEIIGKQNAFLWPLSFFKKNEHTVDTMVTYSKEELERKIDTLCFFQAENIRRPQNAYLSDYTEEGYQVIPEDKGTVPIRQRIYSAVEEAVDVLADCVNLDEKDCYTNARITSTDSELQRICEQKNRLTGVTITYTFGEDIEVLDGNIIKDWLIEDEKGYDIDAGLVREYVNSIARKYDTLGRKREFQTTNGDIITITEGAYGWWMNRAEETEELVEWIKNGKSGPKTPVYRAQAAQYGENDIGDSYVEIDLTSQHLWVYKEGQLVEETDFVSGNVSRGYNTPVGIYSITYKERNATLKGANYASHVNYWMPFNGNVGMHDASWRSSFGEDIYLRGGSHGCVNLPVKKAEVIYEYVEQGEPVIVYGGKTSVPRVVTEEQPESQTEPAETTAPELTPEQQLQLLIDAGLVNPDGTPVQQSQEIPQELSEAPQDMTGM
ncbi:MAG: L,D-transpeptidase/peptidoglycan binding protein [Lachnospiraceae bacterium]|nr:L,D-transpeptidase/peptidoglycan binding protein [Lachnospiraceae bacterium]